MSFSVTKTHNIKDTSGQGLITITPTVLGGDTVVDIDINPAANSDRKMFRITLAEAGAMAEILDQIVKEHKAAKVEASQIRSSQFADH